MHVAARLLRLSLAVLSLVAMATLPAAAEGRRVALVIGNGKYQTKPLANPVRDAKAVAKALQGLGFAKVTLKLDQTRAGMVDALKAFEADAAGADVAVLYFAGHGTEMPGQDNFLVPVDAALAREADLVDEAIPLRSVLNRIEGARDLRLVILDACRNPPFALAGSKRGGTRGLAKVEPEDNTLIAYATKDGTTADDGDGEHSPFTTALLKHIGTPGIDVSFVFREVRDDVLAATARRQQPYLYGTLGRKQVMLAPAPEAVAVAPIAPAAPVQPAAPAAPVEKPMASLAKPAPTPIMAPTPVASPGRGITFGPPSPKPTRSAKKYELQEELKGNRNGVHVALSANNKVVAGGDYFGRITVWELPSGRALKTIDSPNVFSDQMEDMMSAADLVLSPDGRTLAGVLKHILDYKLRIWDLPSGTVRATIDYGRTAAYAVAISQDGRLFVHIPDSGFDVIDLKTGSKVPTPGFLKDKLGSIQLSKDGRLVVTSGNEKVIRVWDLASGAELHSIKMDAEFSPVGWSDNNRTLLVTTHLKDEIGNSNLTRAIDLSSNAILSSFRTSNWPKLSADGHTVVGIVDHRDVVVWDVTTGEKLQSFTPQTDRDGKGNWEAHSLAITSDAKMIVTGHAWRDKRLRIFAQ